MTIDLETVGPAPIDAAAEQVMVKMRDGIALATDVYLPDGDGPFPTILVRLPYDKAGAYTFMPALAPVVNGRGYAFVVQDVRGKFRSEGETVAFDHEADDGYDTLDWIVAQEWATDSVGTFGDSYYGFTQWAAVASEHPALKAMVPRVTAADLGSWLGGVIPLYGALYLAECWADRHLHAWNVDYDHRPLAEVFDAGFAGIGARSESFDRLIKDGQSSPWTPETHPFTKLHIPVLHVVGWFDNIGPAHMADYDRLIADPNLRGYQYLFAGSFDHENYELRDVPVKPHPSINGPTDSAEAQAQMLETVQAMLPLYLDPALDFFDVFLAKRDGATPPPRVRWELGNDEWRTADTWPPAGAKERRFYVADLAQATTDAVGGSLGDAPADAAESAEWTHDPENLVPSPVENPFAFLLNYPDERATEERPDVLTFTSEALTKNLDLAGPIRASLHVGTDHSGGVVHVRLIDVAPNGAAHSVASGQSHLREDGGPTSVWLGHTGYRFRPGHQIRLHIAASDFPLYLPDPGTGEDPWQATDTRKTTYRLKGDSHIAITVIGE